jgi:hypothetical protein
LFLGEVDLDELVQLEKHEEFEHGVVAEEVDLHFLEEIGGDCTPVELLEERPHCANYKHFVEGVS